MAGYTHGNTRKTHNNTVKGAGMETNTILWVLLIIVALVIATKDGEL